MTALALRAVASRIHISRAHFFGEVKICHRLDRPHYRGVSKVDHQAVPTEAVVNLKRPAGGLRLRLAAHLANRAVCESIPLARRLSALFGPTVKAVIPLVRGHPTPVPVLP